MAWHSQVKIMNISYISANLIEIEFVHISGGVLLEFKTSSMIWARLSRIFKQKLCRFSFYFCSYAHFFEADLARRSNRFLMIFIVLFLVWYSGQGCLTVGDGGLSGEVVGVVGGVPNGVLLADPGINFANWGSVVVEFHF